MSTRVRALIVIGVLVVASLGLALLGWRGQQVVAPAEVPAEGFVHLYVDGVFAANLAPTDLAALPEAKFSDAEENKEQAGPWLSDVVKVHVPVARLRPESTITVSGVRATDGSAKSAIVTWAQALDPASNLILDVNSAGDALKLVSTLPGLDTRNTWVQGVARIDVTPKP